MTQRPIEELRWYYQESAADVGMSAAGLEPSPVVTPASAPPPTARQLRKARDQQRYRRALARLNVQHQAILEVCYEGTCVGRVTTCPSCSGSTRVDNRGEGARDVCEECNWYSGVRDVVIDLGHGAGNNAVRRAYEASEELAELQKRVDDAKAKPGSIHVDRVRAHRDQLARDVMAEVKAAHQRYIEIRREHREAESEAARRSETPAQRVAVTRTAELPPSPREQQRNMVAAFCKEIGLDDVPRVAELLKAERS
jgi:hypothetical protein